MCVRDIVNFRDGFDIGCCGEECAKSWGSVCRVVGRQWKLICGVCCAVCFSLKDARIRAYIVTEVVMKR